MTTQTYETNTIMKYNWSDDIVVGASAYHAAPYWAGSHIYVPTASASSSTSGLRKVQIDAPGDEVLQNDLAGIGVAQVSTINGSSFAISSAGTAVFFTSDYQIKSEIAAVQTSDLTVTNTFGAPSPFITPSSTTSIMAPWGMHCIGSGGSEALICTSYYFGEVNAVPLSSFTNTPLTSTDETGLGNRFPGQNYTLAVNTTGTVVGVYHQFTNSITKVGTFTPADVDATWTTLSRVMAPCYDATDDNIITGATTNNSVTNKHYIIKLNASNGDVMWAVPVGALPSGGWCFGHSRCSNGFYYFISNNNSVLKIDTSDGTTETIPFTGIARPGIFQCSDDVTNSIVFHGGFSPSSDPPDYVGIYMDTLGNHSFTSSWARIWMATPDPPDPPDTESLGINFADFTNDDFVDWFDADLGGEDYDSYLYTFYALSNNDEMFWLYSPYVYTYMNNGATATDMSLNVQGAWDWATNNTNNKWTRAAEAYKYRENNSVALAKIKMRGKGRVLQLRFTSTNGKDFQLYGWGIVIAKLTDP